jgi:hypothetical protein
MAREGGLGKSLHEVLDSLKPAESWPDASRLAREQLEQELNELIDEVRTLREQVRGLTTEAEHGTKSSRTRPKKTETKTKKKKHAKKHAKRKG